MYFSTREDVEFQQGGFLDSPHLSFNPQDRYFMLYKTEVVQP
jgi:hypothetical protein